MGVEDGRAAGWSLDRLAYASGRDAHAYYCDTRALTSAQVGALLPLLSQEERRRADRPAMADDRRDYVAAHALLRLVIPDPRSRR